MVDKSFKRIYKYGGLGDIALLSLISLPAIFINFFIIISTFSLMYFIERRKILYLINAIAYFIISFAIVILLLIDDHRDGFNLYIIFGSIFLLLYIIIFKVIPLLSKNNCKANEILNNSYIKNNSLLQYHIETILLNNKYKVYRKNLYNKYRYKPLIISIKGVKYFVYLTDNKDISDDYIKDINDLRVLYGCRYLILIAKNYIDVQYDSTLIVGNELLQQILSMYYYDFDELLINFKEVYIIFAYFT